MWLTASTDMKGATVRRYKFMNNLSAAKMYKIYFSVCLLMYIVYLGVQKTTTLEHRKEQVWLTNTVTISPVNALPVFDRLM